VTTSPFTSPLDPGIDRYAAILGRAVSGALPTPDEARAIAQCSDLPALMASAASVRDAGFGDVITYSRKVFIPLTHLCRDACGYCTFARPPRPGEPAYMTAAAVLDVARAGVRAGCKEALFTLGDQPELRYRAAREALAALGHSTTLSYVAAMATMVLAETGLLPHLNAGIMSPGDIARLRTSAVSMGLMLETASERLSLRGGPHFGSPDKRPSVRLATISAAGQAAVPFTSGILVGIGETREERVEALLELRRLHERYGHIQEIIVQNFCAKPGTRMALAPEPSHDEHLWTIAVARLIFGATTSIQAPPNLAAGALARAIDAGINDWGGVSPVTPDHVNPERPWPALDVLAVHTSRAGKVLAERLAIYPPYVANLERWTDPALRAPALRLADSVGLARTGRWRSGAADAPDAPEPRHGAGAVSTPARQQLAQAIAKSMDGGGVAEDDIVTMFAARGDDYWRVCEAADALRERVSGGAVTYVVNRNINYTNVCYFRCRFCAFSKGRHRDDLRGSPYVLDLDEIARRTREAWSRGATEVCLQGGIHPDYTGDTYIAIVRAVKEAAPDIHVHAFSPLEIWQGAATLGIPVPEFLHRLSDAGLGSLPGTAAEILDDAVRDVICPDKVTTAQWLAVMEAAHAIGLRSTATIMFGHVDHPLHWARHLSRIRTLQSRTGGFTEFVPLPFVAIASPIYLNGASRGGPTLREAVIMHAVARLALHPLITNIQASWVKMGPAGAALCLGAGANDLGGTLMNESITRAAGAVHGQEMPPEALDALVRSTGREPRHRTTLYRAPTQEHMASAYGAPALVPSHPVRMATRSAGVQTSPPRPQRC
jgi:FO synthase